MTRAPAVKGGKKPTVAQAKAAYDAEIDPTLDKVFVKLHAVGFTGMAFSTLQRWKARGWPERVKVLPEIAAEARKVVAEVIHNAPPQPKAAPQDDDDDEPASDADEVKKLAETALAALSEMAMRESLVAQIMLARRVQSNATRLVRMAPKDAAKIIEALKGPTSNVTVVLPAKPGEQPQTVGGKLIEHDANERPLTALQSSIREFRQMKVVK